MSGTGEDPLRLASGWYDERTESNIITAYYDDMPPYVLTRCHVYGELACRESLVCNNLYSRLICTVHTEAADQFGQ